MNRDYFTQPLQSNHRPIGRDTEDYGYTQLGTDEASSPWFWIVGGLVVAMLIWAVVS